jgi:hypothetical protein
LQIRFPDDIIRGFDCQPIAIFTLAQLFFRLFALGDI